MSTLYRAYHEQHGMIYPEEYFTLEDAINGDLTFFGAPAKDYDIDDFVFMPYNEDGEEKITLSLDYFEHLLNCLANQKFLHEMNTEDLQSVQAENQRIIDVAWNTGMRLLSAQRHKDEEEKSDG